MKKELKIARSPNPVEKEPNKRGRPVENDILRLQRTIPATPEKLARVILETPPRKLAKD